MVKALILGLAAMIFFSAAACADEGLDIAQLARAWPEHFALKGTKTEPTYVEQIALTRDRDVFTLSGGAPAGMTQTRESVAVAANGDITALECPAAMRCAPPLHPSGFLASAAILATIRRGALHGRFEPRRFGAFRVICVPAETIGIVDPVLDPCIEIRSGAVLAQRHRRSGQFDGPSLDPWSISLTAGALAAQ